MSASMQKREQCKREQCKTVALSGRTQAYLYPRHAIIIIVITVILIYELRYPGLGTLTTRKLGIGGLGKLA